MSLRIRARVPSIGRIALISCACNRIDQVAMIDLTILGGGPAGLGVAFYAQRAGIPFVLFEKSADLGGMCRTLRHGQHLYDCGAHRFHDQDADITRDVLELMGDEMLAVDAPSMIWDRGRFVDFPPTPLNAIVSCGPIGAVRIGVELLRARLKPRECISFEDFAVGQFGETLARRIVLNYSEKLWGLPAAQLSPDIATRRLKGMTLRSLFLELVFPGKKTTHIDGAFLYPRGGYGRIMQNLESALPHGSLRRAHEIVRLQCEGGAITRIHFADGQVVVPRGRVVSTLPLTVLVDFLGEQVSADARQLPFKGKFDRVLADVPCSGTGTLARNPEIKWRLKPEDLDDLHARQLAILRGAMDSVAAGGRVIYSTCSLEIEENEKAVEQALAQDNSFRLLDCRVELERLKAEGELVWSDAASLTRGPYLRTLPGVHPCDGFFAAIIEKL